MALVCRRCGCELHKPTPFFLDRKTAEEMGPRANGSSWFGWHTEPATDKVWDEAVCLEGMDEQWLEKVNSEPGSQNWTPMEELMHIPLEVVINGWAEQDGLVVVDSEGHKALSWVQADPS